MSESNMQAMSKFGTDFWNDSCATKELTEAVASGAVGATSNPVIVSSVLQSEADTWNPYIAELTEKNPSATEDEIAWLLIEEVTRRAARLLTPVHNSTKGEKGYLSVQTNAKFYRDAKRMFEQGKHLSQLAPNIAIKVPTTNAGVTAMGELAKAGVRINATVSYTLPQALAVAEAVEKSKIKGHYVTLMIGRLDDHLKRVVEASKIDIDPKHLDWAGILVARKAYKIFQERGYHSRLLMAAFRHENHWRELIGDGMIQTIPYKWWTKFNQAAPATKPTVTDEPPKETLSELLEKLPDFRKAYDEAGLQPHEFDTYGATVHTLNQFLGGYQTLVEAVRKVMLYT